MYPDALRSGRYAPCAGRRVHETPLAGKTGTSHCGQEIAKLKEAVTGQDECFAPLAASSFSAVWQSRGPSRNSLASAVIIMLVPTHFRGQKSPMLPGLSGVIG